MYPNSPNLPISRLPRNSSFGEVEGAHEEPLGTSAARCFVQGIHYEQCQRQKEREEWQKDLKKKTALNPALKRRRISHLVPPLPVVAIIKNPVRSIGQWPGVSAVCGCISGPWPGGRRFFPKVVAAVPDPCGSMCIEVQNFRGHYSPASNYSASLSTSCVPEYLLRA